MRYSCFSVKEGGRRKAAGRPPGPRQSTASGCHTRKARVPPGSVPRPALFYSARCPPKRPRQGRSATETSSARRSGRSVRSSVRQRPCLPLSDDLVAEAAFGQEHDIHPAPHTLGQQAGQLIKAHVGRLGFQRQINVRSFTEPASLGEGTENDDPLAGDGLAPVYELAWPFLRKLLSFRRLLADMAMP